MSARAYKQYTAYKDSGVKWLGDIPAHWEVRRLKYLALLNPESLPEETDPGMEMLYIDIGSVDELGRINETERLAFANAPSRARRIVRDGDTIVSTVRTYLRAIAPVKKPEAGTVVSTGFAVVRPGILVDRKYAAYALRTPYFVERVVGSSKGVSFPAINESEMATFELVLPLLAEQRAIATFLDQETARVDELVAKKERLITLLQERRTALITRAVTKGLDPAAPMKDSGVEWLGAIPAHWEVRPFRYCCRVSEGQVPPDDERFRDIILIAPNHIESGTGRLLYTETAHEQGAISGKYRVNQGDIIYSKIRPALNKVCVAQGDWLCSADMYPIRATLRDLTTEYLLFFMLSDPFVRLMRDESMRVAMPKVNRDALAACSILLPPPPEQRLITAAVERQTNRIDALVARIRAAITRLHELRTALISAAVTGKIDVREAVQ